MTQDYIVNDAAEFVLYLKKALIPDLRESGHAATADDFKKAVTIISTLLSTVIDYQKSPEIDRQQRLFLSLTAQADDLQEHANCEKQWNHDELDRLDTINEQLYALVSAVDKRLVDR